MFKSKTYFEQVPLEVVQKIVGEETKQEQRGRTGPSDQDQKIEEELLQADRVLRRSGRL